MESTSPHSADSATLHTLDAAVADVDDTGHSSGRARPHDLEAHKRRREDEKKRRREEEKKRRREDAPNSVRFHAQQPAADGAPNGVPIMYDAMVQSSNDAMVQPSKDRVEGRPGTTLHTWAALAATEKRGHSTSMCRLLLLLSVTPMFLLLRCFIMIMVGRESSYPRCNVHSECPDGNWCVPGYPFTNAPSLDYPGFCHDCVFTSRAEFEADNHPGVDWWSPPIEDWFAGGKLHCDATDVMPDRCDHLARNLHRMSGGVFIVLMCCVVVILHSMVEDVNQSYVEIAILWRRARRIYSPCSKRRMLLKVFCVFAIRMRFFVNPVLLAQTTIALVLAGEMTSQNIVLDSVAVTILCHLDDICRHFVLPPPIGRGTEEVYADEYTSLVNDATKAVERRKTLTEESPDSVIITERDAGAAAEGAMEFRRSRFLSLQAPTPEVRTWILIRVWILLIGFGIFVQILGLETWMRLFGGESAGGTRALCSDIASIGELFTYRILYIAFAVYEVYRLLENIFKGRRSVSQLCARFFGGLLMDAFMSGVLMGLYFCVKRFHSRTIVHGF